MTVDVGKDYYKKSSLWKKTTTEGNYKSTEEDCNRTVDVNDCRIVKKDCRCVQKTIEKYNCRKRTL